MRHLWPLASALLLLAISPIGASDIQLISHSERAVIAWDQAMVENDRSSLSADGRFMVFTTDNPTSSQEVGVSDDVILFDRITGETTLVSHAADDPERAGDDDSDKPVISADGNLVVFQSRATDLVSGFSNPSNRFQLYAWDRATGTTRLVSHTVGSQTAGGNGDARGRVVVSADGAFVVFESLATDYLAGTDTNGDDDLFRWSRATGDIELVSRSAASPTTAGNGSAGRPSISADGLRVAFESRSSDIVAGGADVNGASDVFLWEAGTVTLISESVAGGGATANRDSNSAQISADGTAVVFTSVSSDLLVFSNPVPFTAQIFRWVASSGALELVSHVAGDTGTSANSNSANASISADGQTVAYSSRSTDLVSATDAGNDDDIFRWSASTGMTELLSSPDGGATASLGSCFDPRIDSNASHVLMECVSTDLVPGTDNNGTGRDVFLWRQLDGMVQIVSRQVGDPTSTGSSQSQDGQVSADGSAVLFESSADDLVTTLADGGAFLFDTATGIVEVASRPNAVSTDLFFSPGSDVRTPAVSGNGRFVAFQSSDPFYLDGVTTSRDQIYLFDRDQGEFFLVSRTAADPLAGGSRNSMNPQVSDDGSAVVFVSTAPDLVAGAINVNQDQIYHWDLQSGAVHLVSHVPGNELEGGNGRSREPMVSADGRTVFFVSRASNLTTGGDGNFSDDVFMWDAATGDVRLVSRSAVDATVTSNSGSGGVSISSDGRYAAFVTGATDLVPGFIPVMFVGNVFLWDRQSGDVELVSTSITDPLQSGDGSSFESQVSADGSSVVFRSRASDLLTGFVASGDDQVFHWQRATGEVRLVSRATGTTTTAGDAVSSVPVVSADGDVVAFESRATDLVAGQVDVANSFDVFVWERSTGTMELASRSTAGPTVTGDDISFEPSIAGDGTRVLFGSDARNLVPGFTGLDGENHLFHYERSTGVVRLVNRTLEGPNAATTEDGAFEEALSADGRWVTFLSRDLGLTDGLDIDDSVDVFLASLDDPTNADLQLTLSTSDVTPLTPSEPFSLDVTVDNLSVSSVGDLYAMIALPVGVDLMGFSGAGWTCELYVSTLSCGGGPLSVGAADTLTLDLQAPSITGPFSIGGSTIWPGVDPALANNITTFEGVVATDDWGDAPDPTYPTLDASNGARHGLSGLFLGAAFDVDEDGQPTATADGDDADGSNDDDGVTLPAVLIQGQTETVDVVSSAAGLLDGWIDWNADGDWNDPGEKVADGVAVVAGSNILPLAVPIAATLGDTFARFRLSSAGVAAPTGAAVDGEVEDYRVTVEARTDLSVSKGANPDPVIAGETLTYSLTVTNLGPSPSSGSMVSDVLPGGVTFLSSPDGCVEAGGTVTCPIGALASGSGQTVTFDVTVDPSQVDPLFNTATVVGNETDPAPGNNTSPTVTTTVMAESDLMVTLTDGQTQVNPGDSVTYTLTVSKNGPSDAPGTQVEDVFPAALLNVTWTCTPSAGSSCSASGSGDINDLADLAAGGSVVYEATGTVDVSFAGSLENTATATPAVGVDDPNTSNNTATDVTEVTSPADVSGTLEVLLPAAFGGTSQGFQPGDTVTYLAVLVNASPTAQLDNPGPEFSDTLPVGLALSNASADAGTVTLDPFTGTVEWSGTIPGDGAVAITIEAVVEYGTNGQTLINQGTIFFDADGDGTNESSALTDDPNQGGSEDGTLIVILELVEIPTLGGLGLALLVLVLGGAGVRRLGGRA